MYLDDIKSANTDVIGLFNVGGERGHPARRLVGVASLGVVLDEASITSMCVSPEARGRGLGEALMVGLMRVLAAHAAESICLEVRAESNAPAVALYRKVWSVFSCGRSRMSAHSCACSCVYIM
jgi:ribosomal protein S18 acetylase RimI-like enzyme